MSWRVPVHLGSIALLLFIATVLASWGAGWALAWATVKLLGR